MAEVNSSTQKNKKRWIFWGVIFAILVGIIGFLVVKYGDFLNSFFYPPKENINVLVLGKGGVGHEAPDLTDTIILALVSDEKIKLISLPRDIWVPEIRAKLNSAYYWGGLPLAKSTSEKITGQVIPYGLVIDFSGFKNMIDVLGGVEIDVKNPFIDEKYPIAGKENDACLPCRYETLHFAAGKQLMDGETALKFVRSRNAVGVEGTDIARETRQQLVITAIKDEVTSPEVYLNPVKIKSLWKLVLGSIETDVDQKALGSLIRKIFDSKGSISASIILEDLLTRPPVSRKYDYQYVFIPKTGNWNEIQEWLVSLLK